MSRETAEWLNRNILIGYTDKRGHAWHYKESDQGVEPNHYPGPVPVADIQRRLFNWKPVEVPKFHGLPAGVSSDLSVFGPDGMTPVALAAGEKAVVRDDTGAKLGEFKEGWTPHEFSEWLLAKASLIIDDELGIGSAGLLRGGAVAWVSFEIPDSMRTPEGVEYRPHLLATTSYDGSLASLYKKVVTNVVCDNTHNSAVGEKGPAYKRRHTKYSCFDVLDAQDALGIIYGLGDEFAAEVAELCRIEVSRRDWQRFLDAAYPIPAEKGRSRTLAGTKHDQLKSLWDTDTRVAPWRGTGWGVLQAVSTHAQQMAPVRNVSRPERNMIKTVEGHWGEVDRDTVTTLRRVLAAA